MENNLPDLARERSINVLTDALYAQLPSLLQQAQAQGADITAVNCASALMRTALAVLTQKYDAALAVEFIETVKAAYQHEEALLSRLQK